MKICFVDASAFLAREDIDDPHHDAARKLLAGSDTFATLDLAYYEVGNVAVRGWRDAAAAERLRHLVDAVAADGGLVRINADVLADAVRLAEARGISVYDAGYVIGAASISAKLVSCDLRDLVNRGLAITPQQALETG